MLLGILMLRAFTKRNDVGQILGTARGNLGSQEIVSRNKIDHQCVVDRNGHPPRPCTFEFDAANLGHDIHHHRRRAHSEKVIRFRKVFCTESFQRRTEFCQCDVNSLAVFGSKLSSISPHFYRNNVRVSQPLRAQIDGKSLMPKLVSTRP